MCADLPGIISEGLGEGHGDTLGYLDGGMRGARTYVTSSRRASTRAHEDTLGYLDGGRRRAARCMESSPAPVLAVATARRFIHPIL